jgi:hypothetical protein
MNVMAFAITCVIVLLVFYVVKPPRNEEADGLHYSRFQIDAVAARSHARAAITAAARANAAVANDRDARGQATVRMAGLASVTGR